MKKFAVLSFGIVFAALVCSVSFAAVTTITSPPGAFSEMWNMFALPGIPTAPAPGAIFDEVGGDAGLETRSLYRWDAPGQGLIGFDPWSPEIFGNMLIGDGYWIRLRPGDSTTVSFEGINDNDTTDMWISLPKSGWTIIGHPFSYPAPDNVLGFPYHIGDPYPWESVQVTDGTVTKSMLAASQHGDRWMNSVAYWWDSIGQGYIDLGVPDDFPTSESLIAWHGYWVRSYKDNLALIMDAQTTP